MSKVKKTVDEREVVYPDIVLDICSRQNKERGPLTVEDAKHLLGWEEETEAAKFGLDFLLRDENSKKIRCTNNVTNRPLNMTNVKGLIKDILLGNWVFNAEPIIIGCTGLVLNGQHQMIALILAEQVWQGDKQRWHYWKESPHIDKLVVCGIDESDKTINTMDTCKPRTLWEVICRSEYFSSKKDIERQQCSKLCDWAIKLLLMRTGANLHAYCTKLTHAEGLDVITRHPQLLSAVNHIYEEDNNGRLRQYVHPGTIAGLLYLFATSDSDGKEYHSADPPQEKLLDMSNWNKACDFFVKLAADTSELQSVRKVWTIMIEEGKSRKGRDGVALLIAAWLAYQKTGKVNATDLELDYERSEEGYWLLLNMPICGGIDVGLLKQLDEEEIIAPDPSLKEIIAAKQRIDKKKGREKPIVRLLPKRSCKDCWSLHDVAWVYDEDDEHYLAVLTSEPWALSDNSKRQMVDVRDAKGNEWEVDVTTLSLTRPSEKSQEKKKKRNHVWKVGQTVWAQTSKESWQGKITDLNGKFARLKVVTGFQGAGNTRKVRISSLSKEQKTRV